MPIPFFLPPAFIQTDTTPSPVDAVSCWIGVRGRGNVVVGPQRPWASVNPSPETLGGYSDGYHPDRPLLGFGQLHVTGTGSYGKYGQFLISPQVGLDISASRSGSVKAEEEARITDYRVRFKDGIGCNLVPTEHAVLHRFTYPATDQAHLLVDLGYSIPGTLFKAGRLDEGEVCIDPAARTMRGWGSYWGGWSAEPVRIFFAAKFDRAPREVGTWVQETPQPGSLHARIQGKGRLGAFLRFDTRESSEVHFKIAVSFVSEGQAEAFLNRELPDWDVARVRDANRTLWDRALNRIQLAGASAEQRTQFYTALYHTMRMPRNRTGDNPGWRSDEPYWDDHYCVWDSWKTTFPLHILLHEEMVRDNLRSFIDRHRHNGEALDAFVGGNDRAYKWIGDANPEWLGNQGGDNMDNLFVDAYVKRVKGVDWNAAYQVVCDHADHGRAPIYRAEDRGWVPFRASTFGLSCSRTLEFAYNDFCAAQLAAGLGHVRDHQRYLARSRGWEQLWHREATSDGFSGFIAPRRRNGEWVTFDPKQEATVGSPGGVDRAFYQGSSWIYSFGVPHAIPRLIALCGGPESYVKRLEHALSQGLVDLSNEPSFLTPFTFIYAGRPDLASRWVRTNLKTYTLESYPGDEDSGAMSSWYVFASLGFFPVAGQDLYLLNGPLHPTARITFSNGKTLLIEGVNASPDHSYVQSATLNGTPLTRAWLRHAELIAGGTLRFVMGAMPSEWGKQSLPPAPK